MGGYIDSNGNEFDTKEEYYSNEKTTIKKEIKTEEARTNYQLADLDVMDTIDIALRKKGQKIGDYGVPVSIREEIAPSIDRLERTPLDNSARILAAEAGPESESIPESNSIRFRNDLNVFSPEFKQKLTEEAQEKESLGLTVNDLLSSPGAMQIISDEMYYRNGQTLKNTDPDKLAAKWLAGSRGNDFYNIGYVFGHGYRMLSASEDEREASRRSTILFDVGKGGAYQEGTTARQGIDATVDYIWTVGTDPTTWVALGRGALAKRLAFEKILTKETKKAVTGYAKKITRGAGVVLKDGGDYVDAITKSTKLKAFEKQVLINDIKQNTQRVMRNTVSQFSKSQAKAYRNAGIKASAKAIAITEGVMTSIADWVAQGSALKEGSQEGGRKILQVGISGLGGMVGGLFELGALYGSQIKKSGNDMFAFEQYLVRKAEKIANATTMNVKKEVGDLKQQWLEVDGLKQIKIKFESFFDKAKRGAPLRFTLEGVPLEQSTAVRMMFLFGDEEVGFKGLIPLLKEKGIEYHGPRKNLPKDKRTGKPIKDNFAGWLGDVVKSLPSDVRKEIDAGFKASVGQFVPDYKGKTLVQSLDMDAAYAREAGIVLNQYSQAWTLLHKGLDQTTINKAANDELNVVPVNTLTKILDDVGWLQRQVIRAVVTHPGTTALNVYGWRTASMVQSAADMGRSLLYGREDMIKHLGLNPDERGLWWKAQGMHVKQLRNKFSNLLDPTATADQFNDLLVMFPDESKQLVRYMFGGIESEEEIAKAMGLGFIPANARKATELTLDKAQVLFGVKAVDLMTKQQELLYSIDKLSRRNYGMSYTELLSSPDFDDIMDSGDFTRKIYVPSIQEARRNTFSMKYGAENWAEMSQPVKLVAKTIEDARKIPGLGLLIPFGQFANNTFAYMFDTMGISKINEYFVRKTVGEKALIRDPLDVTVKAGVGFTIIAAYTAKELTNLEDGLGMFEERDRSGQIVEKTYEYPESLYKSLGRLGAHITKDGGVPLDVWKTIRDTHLTSTFRPIGGAMSDFNRNIYEILTGDDPEAVISLATAFSVNPLGSAFQMSSRPFEVVNILTQLMGSDYKVRDRKQNAEFINNTLRYVDEVFMDITGVELAPQKYIAGQKRLPSGSANLGKRMVSPNGLFFTMMNQVGKPKWKAGALGPFKDVNNRLNQLISVPLNEIALEYIDSPDWTNGDVKTRTNIVNAILTRGRAAAKDRLLIAVDEIGSTDGRLARIVNIQRLGGNNETDINNVIKDMSETDPTFLDEESLRNKIPFMDAPVKKITDLTEDQMDDVIYQLEIIAKDKARIRNIGKN